MRRSARPTCLLVTAALAVACAPEAEPADVCVVLAGLCEAAVVRSFTTQAVAMATADLDGDGTRELVSVTPDGGLSIA